MFNDCLLFVPQSTCLYILFLNPSVSKVLPGDYSNKAPLVVAIDTSMLSITVLRRGIHSL